MAIREQIVDRLNTKIQDFHGRRITNAQDAQADQDYLTLGQGKRLFAEAGKTAAAVTGAQNAETYSLSFNGTLAIAADICPRREITASGRAIGVKITLKTAGTSGNITFELYQNSTLWLTLTIPSGLSISATASQLASAADLVEGNYWRVDIITVSGPTFPGSDAVITITT